jgi:hypothetical protein
MHSYWRRNGPPMHISVQLIGKALGIDGKADAPPAPGPSAPQGPTIAQLAAMAPKPL